VDIRKDVFDVMNSKWVYNQFSNDDKGFKKFSGALFKGGLAVI
jgi:hypothetical protein